MPDPTPIRPTDDDARALARRLLDTARFAAIATLDGETGAPVASRIAMATDENGRPLTLISDLSQHTRSLRADPRCSVLVGEPGDKGDPLTHPRLTIQARAAFVPRDDAAHAALRERYLAQHPKSGLYIDFADFNLVRLTPGDAFLNGGFGKAFHLTAADLDAGP